MLDKLLALFQEVDTVELSCDTEETWQHGNSLINYMKLVKISVFPDFTSQRQRIRDIMRMMIITVRS